MLTTTKPTHHIDPDDLAVLRRLAEGVRRGAIPSTLHVEGMTIRIRPAILTPCEADLLTLVGEISPITTSRILLELERREWLHGECTVRRALARLVKAGKLIASRYAPRGYRLPGFMAIIPENIQ